MRTWRTISQMAGLIGVVCIAGVTAMYLGASNEGLQQRLLDSASGDVRSIEVRRPCCDVHSGWTQPSPIEPIIAKLKQGVTKTPPGKVEITRELMLKIVTVRDGRPAQSCFRVVQFLGFDRELFINSVRPYDDCSVADFKYEAGYVSVPNFLT